MADFEQDQANCLRCGGVEWDDGKFITGGAYPLFKPATAGWFSGGKVVNAKACVACGFLELTV